MAGTTMKAGRARPLRRVALAVVLFAATVLPTLALGRGPFAPAPAAAAPVLPGGFQIESKTISPFITQVEFAPDGRIFVAAIDGVIREYDSWADTTPTTFANLSSDVYFISDRGMLAMEIDPNFGPTRPYLYVGYTYDAPPGQTAPYWNDQCPTPPGLTTDGCVAQNRVERLTVANNGAGNTMSARKVLLQGWCQQFSSHSIAGMTFGPDGALYVAAGEGANFNAPDYGQWGGSLSGTPTPVNACGDPPTGAGVAPTPPTAEGGALRAQDLRTPNDPTGLDGSVVRIDPDTGVALPNNPGAGSTDLNARRIVAYGLRNPYSLSFRPGTNELFVGDVGWNKYEEINYLGDPTAGIKNFGWPCYEGPTPRDLYQNLNLNICNQLYAPPGNDVTAPYFYYSQKAEVFSGDGCGSGASAITAMSFYGAGSGNYPSKYQGALFFSDYTRNCVWVMPAGSDGRPDPSQIEVFAKTLDPQYGPVSMEQGPGGDLYYVDLWSGTINRIRYYAGNVPPTAVATATPTGGAVPLSVQFDGTQSSDPEGDVLTYAWDLDGDGQYDDSAASKPSRTYTSAGTVTVGLKVTDSVGASATTTVTVTPGNTPPSVTISSPLSDFTWHVGEQIPFAATASDNEDGSVPGTAIDWSVQLHHCQRVDLCHLHPLQSLTGTASGSLVAPDHDYPAYLTFTATATDSQGAKSSASVDVQPETTSLTLASSPNGLQVSTSDQSGAAPLTRTVIVGSSQTIAAPNQASGSTAYGFDGWSDGGAQTHTVVVNAPTTLTATFSGRRLSIGDVTTVEGTGGSTNVVVPVTLNHANTEPVTVEWSTAPDTAVSPGDFTASSGTLSFAPGVTVQNVVVPVAGDANAEPTERFAITLANPVKATLARAAAAVAITDDDGYTGPSAYAGADFSVLDKQDFTITGSGTSPQNLPLTYHWTQISGPVAVLTNDNQSKVSVKGVNGPTTMVFRLTVTDSNSQTHTDDVTVTVKAPK